MAATVYDQAQDAPILDTPDYAYWCGRLGEAIRQILHAPADDLRRAIAAEALVEFEEATRP